MKNKTRKYLSNIARGLFVIAGLGFMSSLKADGSTDPLVRFYVSLITIACGLGGAIVEIALWKTKK